MRWVAFSWILSAWALSFTSASWAGTDRDHPFAIQKVYSVDPLADFSEKESSFLAQLKHALDDLNSSTAAVPELTLFFDSHGNPGAIWQQGKADLEYSKLLNGILDLIGERSLRLNIINTACHSGSMREELEKILRSRKTKNLINVLTAAPKPS